MLDLDRLQDFDRALAVLGQKKANQANGLQEKAKAE
jgi:hypothetical protein